MENQEEILKKINKIEKKTGWIYSWVLFLGIITIIGLFISLFAIAASASKF